jgi:hypothetical protein
MLRVCASVTELEACCIIAVLFEIHDSADLPTPRALQVCIRADVCGTTYFTVVAINVDSLRKQLTILSLPSAFEGDAVGMWRRVASGGFLESRYRRRLD